MNKKGFNLLILHVTSSSFLLDKESRFQKNILT